MLGKRSRSVIGRLSGLLVPGSLSSLLDGPSTPLRRNQQEDNPNPGRNDKSYNNNNNNSSSSIRNFDLGHHGVGLGIVVALLSSSSGGGGGTSPCSKYFVCSPGGYGRSDRDPGEDYGSAVEEEEEDYTYVTFHSPTASFTMVYYDQIEKERSDRGGDRSDGCRIDFPGQGFLSSCQLCGKKLHGQDIYMYRGEKGFCSVECRSAQVMMDERNELCRSDAADGWSYSSSTYTEGQILKTSILAV